MRSEVVIPRQLDASARRALSAGLYRVHREVFGGVDEAAFTRYVVESKAEHTWIQVHRGDGGEIVGYFALHVFERQLNGRTAAVFRAEAGTLRAYRGRNANATFGIQRGLAYMATYPTRPIYYLGALVHPSSYGLFAKYFDTVWPSVQTPPPPDIVAFMDDLATSFGLERVSPDDPLTRKVGWQTLDSEVERSYWRQSKRASARFFIERNPGYGSGDGLVTLVPVSPVAMRRFVSRVAAERVARRTDALRAAARGTFVGNRLLRPADVRRHLAETPFFALLDEAAIEELAAVAQVVSLPSGSVVFRRGDRDDALYVIAQGSAYVLVEERGAETILEQLPSGSLFGEIAMISGEARTATVRTVGATTLIRIEARTVMPMIDRCEALRDAVWADFTVRRFDDYTRDVGHLGELPRDVRLELVRQGAHETLGAGETLHIDGNTVVFVLTGMVYAHKDDLSLVARAPALFESETGLTLAGRGPAHIIRIKRSAGMETLRF
jgi:CRP-like cAMP-binding protein